VLVSIPHRHRNRRGITDTGGNVGVTVTYKGARIGFCFGLPDRQGANQQARIRRRPQRHPVDPTVDYSGTAYPAEMFAVCVPAVVKVRVNENATTVTP
jgi:hypothetical protein